MDKRLIGSWGESKWWIIFLLGFSSGLPLLLTGSTLTIRLREAGITRTDIGLFASVATPYVLKFLWSPLVDNLPLPIFSFLGQRRGWMVASQLFLMGALLLLGFSDPKASIWMFAGMAVLVAFLSATQDIVIDAYRVEILEPEEYGRGAAMAVLGYRIGMVVSGAGALYAAEAFGWTLSYTIMAALIGLGMAAVLYYGEPQRGRGLHAARGRTFASFLKESVIAPFADFATRPHWKAILLFILFYKFSDAFMGAMTSTFYIDMGFTKEQIGSIVKLFGMGATILSSFFGAWLIGRIGIARSLFVCGIVHAVTNLMFLLIVHAGADVRLLALSITLENISGGMGTAAFVAFASALCNVRYTATQFALISSVAALGRTLFSTPAGWVADTIGWEGFFWVSSSLAIPGLLILYWLSRKISFEDLQRKQEPELTAS